MHNLAAGEGPYNGFGGAIRLGERYIILKLNP
jgi:hypothetical protein